MEGLIRYKMKYSKDLKGEGGPKRALNLITGQVAYTPELTSSVNEVPKLMVLAKSKLNTFAYPHSLKNTDLKVGDFFHFRTWKRLLLQCV